MSWSAHPHGRSIRSGLKRFATLALLVFALSTLGVFLPSGASWAVHKPCGTPGGAACPPPVPITTPYTYAAVDSAGFDRGTFYSLADAAASYSKALINNSGYCTAPLSSTTELPTGSFWGPMPQYTDGIATRDAWKQTFPSIGFTPQCNNPPFTFNLYLLGTRKIYCPAAEILNYTAGPPAVGPTCGRPGLPPPPAIDLGKVPGDCTAGARSPAIPQGGGFPENAPNTGGANSGTGRKFEANPCDVSNGNKYQREVDYAGSGSNALEFVRSYNSISAYLDYLNPATVIGIALQEPVGAGWTATYFQKLILSTETDSTGTYSTMYAYRPDGRILAFNYYSSTWVPDGDVADTLVQTATGYQYVTAGDTVETYDTNGTLLSIARRGQSAVTLSYSGTPSFVPSSVSDAFGHTLTFAYQQDSNHIWYLTTLTDPAGHTITYTHSPVSNSRVPLEALSSVTFQDSTVRSYVYGTNSTALAAHLMQVTDESSTAYAMWTYDGTGQFVQSSKHAGGADYYQFGYQLTGGLNSRTIIDPLGTTRTFNMQIIQNVSRTLSASAGCGGCGDDSARVYDSSGNIISKTDFNGVQTTYVYDTDRNLETSRTEAYGTARARTIATAWDANFREPDTMTEPNRTIGFTYDAAGNVLTKTITDTSVTPNVSRTWTYTYDGYGRVLTADGPRTDVSDVTTYTYYICRTGSQCGQVHTETDAAGNVTTYSTYNGHGQPLTITDSNGVVTTLTYDTRQRLSSRQVGSETTSFSYYPTGLLKQVTLPDSSFLFYTYDGAHRLTQINDGLGNKVVYTLDAMGNRTAENAYDPSSTLHRTHSRVFNTLNQLYQDVNAAGTAAVTTTFGYDSNGNQTSIAAPLTRNTANAYDELNRLKQITDPASGITQFGYDANDNLLTVTDPRSLSTSYTYTGFGDLKTQVSPDTGTTTDTYDSGGNLATSTDARGAVATYAYDALNRVSSVAYSQSGTTDQTISFGYDAGTNGKGRLTSASDANHSLGWSYDPQGRVVSKTQTVGTVTKSVAYAYTSGDLTTLTTPSGQAVTYGYNSNHQVTSITVNGTTVLNSVTYEPLGPVNGWTWGNSTSTTRTYDTDQKITQISSGGMRTVSYDSAFRITGISDTATGGLSWTYGYDALDRITSGGNGTISRGWTYDADGNRLTETGSSPSTYTITTGSNQITSITGTLARTYDYDAAGNTTGYSTVTAAYNDAGRLQTVTNGAVTETLTYNALGQRIRTSGGPAGTVLYWYDEAGRLVGEYDGSGNLIEETVWLGDIPVATLRPNGTGVSIYYVHSDQLNAPRQVTRPSDNAQMWTWFSDPFGTDAANENPAGAGTFTYNLRLPGQVFDGTAGLHQNYFRDYDPAVGRYVESDMLGLAAGVNTYAYAKGDPVDLDDPSGMIVVTPLYEMMQKLFQKWGGCNRAEENYCVGDCASRGREFESCRVRIIKIKEIWGGKEVAKIVRKWPPSCSCKDPDACPNERMFVPPLLSPQFFPSSAPILVPAIP